VDDVAELIVRVLERRSIGALNIATGDVHSFLDIAKATVELFDNTVEIKTTPRVGPMPHDGYRPFDIALCKQVFPDFSFTPMRTGLRKSVTD
jgi:UDP-glucose 4-epimerase